MERIGVLHPGAMGAAIGRELTGAGRDVCWVPANRGASTRQRAEAAGLEPVPDLAEMAATCAVILSVCPPAAATSVAEEVAATGYRGLYVDANAIAPERVRAMSELLPTVDGGIVGPPPGGRGRTWLYLSGPGADRAASLFDGTQVETRVLSDVGQASALKLAFAAYNKITYALAASSFALARENGVFDELRDLAGSALPGTPLADLSALAAAGAKAWRWAPEMREVAASSPAPGIAEAAAELFACWEQFKDSEVPLDRLLDQF